MKKTPLHESHLSAGAKMGAFAGYDMPLYYPDGVMAEHEWVRSHAGLFDVSHMGQIILEGPGIVSFLEKITPSSFSALPSGRAKYTVMTNDQGGIVDDLIITSLGEERFFAVINAGCKEKDIDWIGAHLPPEIKMTALKDRALIALQGPFAHTVLNRVFNLDTEGMPYMWLREDTLPEGAKIFLSRLGYTGEDGFELSVPASKAADVWAALLSDSDVRPIGLAARDSLRLEMGYCLYGHDIDDKTTPIEAGLSWVMGKDNKSYIGADHVCDEPSRARVGVRLLDKGVAREGAVILDAAGQEIGTLSSGGFSPTLKESIGQGYVPVVYAKAGTKVLVDVRGRKIAAEIADMPFVPARTRSMKKQAA